MLRNDEAKFEKDILNSLTNRTTPKDVVNNAVNSAVNLDSRNEVLLMILCDRLPIKLYPIKQNHVF